MQTPDSKQQAFRAVEIIGVREVSDCVPQILIILAVFSAACVLIGIIAPDHVRIFAFTMGVLGCLSTAIIGAYAVFVRPEFLKTARHEQKRRPFEAL